MDRSLRRQIWLVEFLRRGRNLRMTQAEIMDRYKEEQGEEYGSSRTFHRDKEEIYTEFGVRIECSQNEYSILEEQEVDGLRKWLLESYSVLNQLAVDRKLEGRILFEDNPSGARWLTTFTRAMREGKMVRIEYCSFDEPNPYEVEAAPYYLRVYRQRWYAITHVPAWGEPNDYNAIRIFGFDRIRSAEVTETSFEISSAFDIQKYYDGCCGIHQGNDFELECVKLRARGPLPNYLRSLPLHASQKEEHSEGEWVHFTLYVKPNFDFFQLMHSYGNQIEVLEPAWVREQMRAEVREIASLYAEG